MTIKSTGKSKKSAKNVLEFYFLTTHLKELIRTGWKQWNVDQVRLESVAEHIYGTCMLAIAMDSEYEYDVDIKKVILMLTVHELEEIVISDITPFQGISEEEKQRQGHEAIKMILKILGKGAEYQDLIYEFDARETKEARYAYYCDKLEANLMSLKYDENEEYTLDKATKELQENAATIQMSEGGKHSMSKCFYLYECQLDRLDENFREVLESAWQNHEKGLKS